MSLKQQLWNDLSKEDFIIYGLNQCNLEQLEKYQKYLNNKIERMIIENHHFLDILKKIDQEICNSEYCRSLKDDYYYLSKQYLKFLDSLDYYSKAQLFSGNIDSVKLMINTDDFFQKLFNHINNKCILKNEYLDLDYYKEKKQNIQKKLIDIFIKFFIEQSIPTETKRN
jgi:hypothetical protein